MFSADNDVSLRWNILGVGIQVGIEAGEIWNPSFSFLLILAIRYHSCSPFGRQFFAESPLRTSWGVHLCNISLFIICLRMAPDS